MKKELIELYNDALLLSNCVELERMANGMLPALYPGRELEELSNEELVSLNKAIITGMTSWLY